MTASTQAFAGLLGVFFLVVLFSAPGPSDAGGGAVLSTGMRVDPNTSDASTLELLPGVGPGIAEHIIAARESGVIFHSAEDLEAVKFIGPNLVERVRPWTVYGKNRLAGELARPNAEQAPRLNTGPEHRE
ncbi:MAG: helix-hairpin-helix domain-containing protein [Phycisphaerales bacterium]